MSIVPNFNKLRVLLIFGNNLDQAGGKYLIKKSVLHQN